MQTIMIVEDDAGIRHYLQSTLSNASMTHSAGAHKSNRVSGGTRSSSASTTMNSGGKNTAP